MSCSLAQKETPNFRKDILCKTFLSPIIPTKNSLADKALAPCVTCTSLGRSWKLILESTHNTTEKPFEKKIQDIEAIQKLIREHRLKASLDCLPNLKDLAKKAHREFIKLQLSLVRLTEAIEGSFTRVLDQQCESSIKGRGYFFEYFIEDTLNVLNRFASQKIIRKEQLNCLQALRAILLRSRDIENSKRYLQYHAGDGNVEQADRMGISLADELIKKAQLLQEHHQIWVPIVTGVHGKATKHGIILCIQKTNESTLDLTLINVGYRCIQTEKPNVCYDINIDNQPIDTKLRKSLELLLSFHGDTAYIYDTIKRCWEGQFYAGTEREIISRPLCISLTLRSLYREFLGKKLYQMFMLHWSFEEARLVGNQHNLTGPLPDKRCIIRTAISTMDMRKYTQHEFTTCPSESDYQLHMKGLAQTVLSRVLALGYKQLKLIDIPPELRQHIYSAISNHSTTEEDKNSEQWTIVLPHR